MESLESVIDGTAEIQEELPLESKPAEQEVTKVDKPEVEPKVETGETTAPKAEEEPKSVPIAALMAEREKRQTAERLLNERQPQQKAPDIFEDQAAYSQHVNEQMNTALFNERANMSEFYARREYPDLDEKILAYESLVKDNPALQQQVMSAPSPYHEMYDLVQKSERLEQMKDVDGFEAKLRVDLEAKIRAEMKEEAQSGQKLRADIPTSLVSTPSKGSVKQPAWAGASPLSDIFGD